MVRWLRSLKMTIIFISLAVAAAGVAGLMKVGFNADSRVYFGEDTQERKALADLEKRHGRYSIVTFVVFPQKGSVYAPNPLLALSQIVAAVRQVPEAIRYSAIIEPPPNSGLDVPVGRWTNGSPLAGAFIGGLRDYAQGHVRWSAPLISADEKIAAVIVTLDEASGIDARPALEVVAQFRSIRDEVKKRFPDVSIMLTGSAVLDATFIDALKSDLLWLVPAQVLLLILLLLVTLRAVTATLALLMVLGVAVAATVGSTGWLGMTLNGVTSAVPTVLLGLAVATCVHIILSWQDGLRATASSAAALDHAIAVNLKPVTLAIVTTMASFLCLNFSNSPPFQQFGNLVAVGLAITYVLSFTMLPVLLLLIPASPALSRKPLEDSMARLGAGVLGRHRLIIVFFVAAGAVSIFGIERLRFDDTFSHYFSKRFEFRQATDLYEDQLTGITVVDFSIDAGGEGNAVTRENLEKLERFGRWLERQPNVASVTSILDIFQAFGSNRPGVLDEAGLPASEMASTLMADGYEKSNAPHLPPSLLDDVRRHARVSVVLQKISSAELLKFADAADRRVEELWGTGAGRATGLPILAAHLSHRNTQAMLTGTFVALLVISLVLVFALGGIRLGLVSLVPNILPLVLAYGFWGMALEEISFAATVVIAMTFGIVVDDTVHILSRYQHLLRDRGLDGQSAIIESFRTVGVAVLITSLSIGSGFAVLSFSGFLVNQHLGLLTVITLVAALLTDLLLLPALLKLLDRPNSQRE